MIVERRDRYAAMPPVRMPQGQDQPADRAAYPV